MKPDPPSIVGAAVLRGWVPAVTVLEASYALWALVVGCLAIIAALERRRTASVGAPATALLVVAVVCGLALYLFAAVRTLVNYAAVAVLAYVAGAVTMEIVDELVRIEL